MSSNNKITSNTTAAAAAAATTAATPTAAAPSSSSSCIYAFIAPARAGVDSPRSPSSKRREGSAAPPESSAFSSAAATANNYSAPYRQRIESVAALRALLEPLDLFSNTHSSASKRASSHASAFSPAAADATPLPSSSSEAAAAEAEEEDFAWIDLQRPSRREAREVLSLLPLHPSTRRRILAGHATDRLEFFPAHGYTVVALTACEAPQAPPPQPGGAWAEGNAETEGGDTVLADNHSVDSSSSSSSSSSSVSSLFSWWGGGSSSTSGAAASRTGGVVRPRETTAELLPPVSIFVVAFARVLVTVSSDAFLGETELARVAAVLSGAFARYHHHHHYYQCLQQQQKQQQRRQQQQQDATRAREDQHTAASAGAAETTAAQTDTAVAGGAVPNQTSPTTTAAAGAFPASSPSSSPLSPGAANARPPALPPSRWACAAVFGSLVSSLVSHMQSQLALLQLEVDQQDELVLQILPSQVDLRDMLSRTRALRHRVAAAHVNFLLKARVLQQLMLPIMMPSSSSSSSSAAAAVFSSAAVVAAAGGGSGGGAVRARSRSGNSHLPPSYHTAGAAAAAAAANTPYTSPPRANTGTGTVSGGSSLCVGAHAVLQHQRSLMVARVAIRKLRRARDMVNASNLTLISGVAARLSQHCHYMDYLNKVQAQIALVVMPVNVIPGLFAMNVKVPWEDAKDFTPFIAITVVTLTLLFVGVGLPLFRLRKFRTPGSLAPVEG